MLTRQELMQENKRRREHAKRESRLWPIMSRFSVANRAIRQARRVRREGSECYDLTEYVALLDMLESAIVNDPQNW